MDKKCEMCGKMMHDVRKDRRFCGECMTERRAMYQETYRTNRALGKKANAGTKARESCNPSVENCMKCEVPVEYCIGGTKKSKFLKITADEKKAIKDANLREDVTTVDAIHEAL